jgi:hypothetical protein
MTNRPKQDEPREWLLRSDDQQIFIEAEEIEADLLRVEADVLDGFGEVTPQWFETYRGQPGNGEDESWQKLIGPG